MFASLVQVACPWAAQPDVNTVLSDPMVCCTMALQSRAQRPDAASGSASGWIQLLVVEEMCLSIHLAVPIPVIRQRSQHTQSPLERGGFCHKTHCIGCPLHTDTGTPGGGEGTLEKFQMSGRGVAHITIGWDISCICMDTFCLAMFPA